jgi:hypothetical protein
LQVSVLSDFSMLRYLASKVRQGPAAVKWCSGILAVCERLTLHLQKSRIYLVGILISVITNFEYRQLDLAAGIWSQNQKLKFGTLQLHYNSPIILYHYFNEHCYSPSLNLKCGLILKLSSSMLSVY